MGWLSFVLPFAAMVSLNMALGSMLAAQGKPGHTLAAGLATFVVGLLAVLALRHRYGRQSAAAYLTLIATTIPLTTGGFAIGGLVTDGASHLTSALVAAPIVLLILTTCERLLYTADERKALRAITSGRAKPSEKPE